MRVPSGSDRLEYEYKGPTNSISLIYGNGYDKCGPLVFKYLTLDGVDEFNLKVFETNTERHVGFADDFSMSLLSERTGTEMTANATLHIELEKYPTSIPATFQVNLTYRECFPTDFSGPFIED